MEKRLWMPQIGLSIMLLWALNDANPYGYYTLLRIVACGVMGYVAIQALSQGKEGLALLLGMAAVLYNPILPVRLARPIWSVINIATTGLVISSIAALRKPPPGQAAPPDTGGKHS